MVTYAVLYSLYFLKVFFLVSLILSLFGICYSTKKILVVSFIQAFWDTIVFNNHINLMLGLLLMTLCLILLYIMYLKLLPLYGIILGLISQSLCLTLKFGGYSIISTLISNLSFTPSVFVCDVTTLVIEITIMSILLTVIKSKNYLVFEICKILPTQSEKGNEVNYEEK
ncbi:hypothetical protein COB47_0484 [Caldicellulosiruptor obsidiansis OB47]|uniref:Uncharacterized protein n=1 Tax=Caldicellulosiruptor obsidiansis (strain ATCC BAA-2073 / JCM 16842 / OB47) TaxID=608506 RepID=D9TIH5_CALOO|nr:hypothetical protein COB47_0484 [Caldicellulosiruptor obsidiansis OB47]